MSYRKVQTAALTNISLPISSNDENEEVDTSQKTTVQSNSSEQLETVSKPKLRNFAEVVDAAVKNNSQTSNTTSAQGKSSDFVLKFKQLIEEKKDWFKSDERRKKASQKDAANILKSVENTTKTETKDKKFFSRFLNKSNTSQDILDGVNKPKLPNQSKSLDQDSSSKINEEDDFVDAEISDHADDSSASMHTDDETGMYQISHFP